VYLRGGGGGEVGLEIGEFGGFLCFVICVWEGRSLECLSTANSLTKTVLLRNFYRKLLSFT
jgi:hypothetical protein